MFEFLSKLFRRKVVDLEANLYPTPECTYGGKGELEIEVWSDGACSMEASIKHCGIENGTEMEFFCCGQRVAALVVNGGYAKQKFQHGDATQLADVGVGDEADIRVRGTVLYQGQFERD